MDRKEKKRVEKELLSTFKDESIIVMADWLKVIYSLLPAVAPPPTPMAWRSWF
jgi:hypothetical protein